MKTFRIFALIIFATISVASYSQIGVTSYSIYALGINTSQSKKVSGELKIFANRDFDNLLMEIDGFYNFKPGKYHRFSIGLGINIEPFKGGDFIHAFTVPSLIEIFPLQDFKKISLIFELAPEFVIEDNARLRSLWGIRYTFGE